MEDKSNGIYYFVDFDRIKKHDGYVYYWNLVEYPDSQKNEVLSTIVYLQGDCKLFRQKILQTSDFTGSMGTGSNPTNSNREGVWEYIIPDSVGGTLLQSVCSH